MAQLMPLPLTVSCFSKIQMVLTFWYQLPRVVPDKGPLNGCVCVFTATKLLDYNLAEYYYYYTYLMASFPRQPE